MCIPIHHETRAQGSLSRIGEDDLTRSVSKISQARTTRTCRLICMRHKHVTLLSLINMHLVADAYRREDAGSALLSDFVPSCTRLTARFDALTKPACHLTTAE